MCLKSVTLFIEDEGGATAIEYALIGALVSIVMITALVKLGESLSNTFVSINAGLAADVSSAPQARP